MTDTKKRTKRQLVDQVRHAALDGNWAEVITLNLEFIERFPRDADAHNRLGRGYLENHRFTLAYEAFSNALKIDPANMIARRNLQRLELLRRKSSAEEGDVDESSVRQVIPRTNVFIEEVGKTWVDELVNPVEMEDLADVSSGEQLFLEVRDGRLTVQRQTGERLGEIEAKTAERVIALINGGNRYEVYALGLSTASFRVILREVYRDPSLAGKVSFPRQISQTRAYLRERDLLRQRDESDFFMLDDDDELDEDEAGPPAADEDESTTAESDTFEEDPVVVGEEESRI